MNLQFKEIKNYKPSNGSIEQNIKVSYELFGQPLHSAPIVLVNHALTGNSDVTSPEKGWWKDIVGNNKLIDLQKYTVIAFNISGNGYDGTFIENYKDFTTADIARLFHLALEQLDITNLYAIIGGSLGGGIAWEMVGQKPSFAEYIIPVVANYQASDWIIAHDYVQESIIAHSTEPLRDARKMAMLFYRTPKSLTQKFNRTKTSDNRQYNVESWLQHHAEKIEQRFDLKAYRMMNHLLSTIQAIPDGKTAQEVFKHIKSTIIQVSVNSDLLFTPEQNIQTKKLLDELGIVNEHYQIESIDGHDAFLIEHQQLTKLLSPIFKKVAI